MNLNALITGPARAGLAIGKKALDLATGASRQAVEAVQSRLGGRPKLDDDSLADRVEAELFDSRRATNSKVDVDCADGVVWLRGEVKTPALVVELEDQTAAIPEVIRVENLLRVAKPKPKPRRPAAEKRIAAPAARPRTAEPAPAGLDETINRRVETELFRAGYAPKGQITVRTTEGVVYLQGEAGTAGLMRDLETRAAAVPDVKRVENLLRVATTPPAPAPLADVPPPATEPEPAPRRFTPEQTPRAGESPAAPFPTAAPVHGGGNGNGAPGDETAG